MPRSRAELPRLAFLRARTPRGPNAPCWTCRPRAWPCYSPRGRGRGRCARTRDSATCPILRTRPPFDLVMSGVSPTSDGTRMTNRNPPPLPEAQMGPAEKLLDLLLNASAHVWHNRPGLDVAGQWHPAKGKKKLPPG